MSAARASAVRRRKANPNSLRKIAGPIYISGDVMRWARANPSLRLMASLRHTMRQKRGFW